MEARKAELKFQHGRGNLRCLQGLVGIIFIVVIHIQLSDPSTRLQSNVPVPVAHPGVMRSGNHGNVRSDSAWDGDHGGGQTSTTLKTNKRHISEPSQHRIGKKASSPRAKKRKNGTLTRKGLEASKVSKTSPYSVCESARLMPPGSMDLVALQSSPGSGNTWVRYLLERATGILTGSVFCDHFLKRSGFEGECESELCGCTIVVKNHWFNEKTIGLPWRSAIYLMRNPYDAFIAERNRQHSHGHTGYTPRKYFEGNGWKDYVRRSLNLWATFFRQAMDVFSNKVLVVHYEDLKEDLETQLRRMIEFLGADSATKERIQCTLAYPTGKFKRPKKKTRTFDPYSEEQKREINSTITEVLRQLHEANMPLPPYAKDYKTFMFGNVR